MDVRYSQEPEVGMVLKNGLKESKEVKDSQGSLSKTLLKEPQDSFSSSGAMENCEKSRVSTGDPDYCRRILVRGKRLMFCSDGTMRHSVISLKSGRDSRQSTDLVPEGRHSQCVIYLITILSG